ncbi:MAG TPA: hypothetical protein VJ767_10315 [Nitrososphaeraceae archaeon]|jgi:hypothetical protein|nr:hypothetical protein [Nitrososphaeraceae archaeon]
MSRQNSENNDKIVYFGVININENGRTIGAVDIWRSVITKELFCEEKRLGVLDIVDYIGMPKIENYQKWAVVINKKRLGKDRWKLIKLVKEGLFSFYDTDDETYVKTVVKDYHIDDNDWWSFLVEKNVNRTVEVTKEIKTK